jgi:hypothetical protein
MSLKHVCGCAAEAKPQTLKLVHGKPKAFRNESGKAANEQVSHNLDSVRVYVANHRRPVTTGDLPRVLYSSARKAVDSRRFLES